MSLTYEQVIALSLEQRNLMIAQLCGWKMYVAGDRVTYTVNPAKPNLYGNDPIPNYCGSLDALATAEAQMSITQKLTYCGTLNRLGKLSCERDEDFDPIFAKSEQRAIAFLMVMGKEAE